MKVSSILDIMIELAFALVALPFVISLAVRPWSTMGGFDSKIEKTALETSGTLQDDILQFTGADMYLSLAVADGNQPQPNKIRFYSNNNTASDPMLNAEDDGFKNYNDNYFQVFYSTQKNPSAINNKVSVSRKVIAATDYDCEQPVALLLKPRTALLTGDHSKNPNDDSDAGAWYVNCTVNELKGDYKTKAEKHGWFCLQ